MAHRALYGPEGLYAWRCQACALCTGAQVLYDTWTFSAIPARAQQGPYKGPVGPFWAQRGPIIVFLDSWNAKIPKSQAGVLSPLRQQDVGPPLADAKSDFSACLLSFWADSMTHTKIESLKGVVSTPTQKSQIQNGINNREN